MIKEVLEGKARSDPGFPGRTAYELCTRYLNGETQDWSVCNQWVYGRLSVIGAGIPCRCQREANWWLWPTIGAESGMNNKNVVPGSISGINIVGSVDRQNGLHKRESVAWHYNSS